MNSPLFGLPHVLLLDPSADVIRSQALTIEESGARVVCVNDPRDALETILRQAFDLLWVVLGEDDRGGVLLLEELHREQRLRRLPAIVTMDLPDVELERKLHNLGVRRIFTLDCEPELLADAIFEEIEDSAFAS